MERLKTLEEMPGALSYPIEKVRGQRHYKIVNFQILIAQFG